MKNTHIFITGIGTDVGKTIVSAIVTESLQADYWKPIQAGNLDESDSITVEKLLTNTNSIIHAESYRFSQPKSPHFAAELDAKYIEKAQISRPKTENTLVIEGAGGLLVPLYKTFLIANLLEKDDFVIVVSKHYLGSINHTLLTLNELQSRNIQNVGIVFVGDENKATESIISLNSNAKIIGRIPWIQHLEKQSIKREADAIYKPLLDFINS